MSLHQVQNIFIGDGTAIAAGGSAVNTTNIASGDLAVIKNDMTLMSAGNTVANSERIYIAQGSADTVSPIKRSFPIYGRQIIKYEGASYTAATRGVWAIGHNRKTTTGTITASNSTLYKYSITILSDKQLFSERNLRFGFSFTTDSTATQSEIADTIVSQINAQTGLKDLVTAVKVGDGTGAYGLTGATDYGVEIWSDLQTALVGNYKEDRVDFQVAVDDTTGFGSATTCAQIQAMTYGVGTYNQVRNLEDFDYQYLGVTNRRQWPIPTLTYAASSTLINSLAITPTSSTTIGEDAVTFSASVSGILAAGDFVEIDGVNYEIKYFVSTTVAILTAVATTTNAAGAVDKRMLYDMISIEFNDLVGTDGAGVVHNAQKSVVIAVPAIDANGAYNSQSAQLLDLLALLNPYMNSLGFAVLSL